MEDILPIKLLKTTEVIVDLKNLNIKLIYKNQRLKAKGLSFLKGLFLVEYAVNVKKIRKNEIFNYFKLDLRED